MERQDSGKERVFLESKQGNAVIWGRGRNSDAVATLCGFRFRFAIPMTQVAAEANSNLYTNYCIVVHVIEVDENWTVLRRLTHFSKLNKLIKKAIAEKGMVFKQLIRPLPKRRYFDSFKTPVIRKRKRQLLEYLQDILLVAEREPLVRSLVFSFLDIDEDALNLDSSHPNDAVSQTGFTDGHLPPQIQVGQPTNRDTTMLDDGKISPISRKARMKSPKNGMAEFEPERRTKMDAFVSLMTHPIKQGWLLRQRWQSARSTSQTENATPEEKVLKLIKQRTSEEADPFTDTSVGLCLEALSLNKNDESSNNCESALTNKLKGLHSIVPPSPSDGSLTEEGFLTKRGGFRGGRKSWKQRFFQMKDRCLFYYAPSDGTLLGCMPLGDTTGIVLCMDDEQARLQKVPQGKFGFIVSTQDRDLSLFAENEQDRDRWIRAIRIEMERGRQWDQWEPQTPTNLLSVTDQNLQVTKSPLEGCPTEVNLVAQAQDQEHIVSASSTPKHEPERKPSGRLKRQETPPFPASLKADQEPTLKGKVVKEEDSLDAPDLQLRDPWEVDWSQIELSKMIGHGAFGKVYRGKLWGSEVAVKKLHCTDLSASALRALRKEVTILSQLRHPCVVLYIGACTVPPNVCMVTEWCARGSLYDILHSNSIVLDTRRRLDLALQIAQGMSYLHGRPKQIIHRDLKSMNVLITQAWQAKVADFGLTIVRRKSEFLEDDEGGHFGIQGTPQWMAPEVMEGNRYNGKVDVYSFGIMLTELMTRKMPFTDKYKGFDFVDGVLEEGATPTIPAWACTNAVIQNDTNSLVEELEEEVDFESKSNVTSPPIEDRKRISSSRFQRISKIFLVPPTSTNIVLDATVGAPNSSNVEEEDEGEEEEEEEEYDEDEEEEEEAINEHLSASKPSPKPLHPKRPIITDYRQYRNGSIKTVGRVKGMPSDSFHNEEKHPKNIQTMVLACLSRDPRSRPSFQSIVVSLSKLLENNSDDMLEYFDLPRLHELIELGTLSDTSMAAVELAALGHRVQHGLSFLPNEENDLEEDETMTGEYLSMSSISNTKRDILVQWACPLIVRLVERVTRETDLMITTRGDRVFLHIPARILSELAVSISVLLQVCSSDDGVTMQAANVILDQGALIILVQLFLFADAAQEFEKVKIKASVYDHEAELEQVLKNRNPDYNSLLQMGLMLSYLAVTCQGRVTDAITKTLLDQFSSVDSSSHLSTRAKSRCESAGIFLKQDGTISYHYNTNILPSWVSPIGPPGSSREAIRSFRSGSGSFPSGSTAWVARPSILTEQVEDLKEENMKLQSELAELRRKMDQICSDKISSSERLDKNAC